MKLSNEERKIYDLVVKRFLSVLMRPVEYTQMNVTVEVAEESFIAKGKIPTSKVFKEATTSR